jgi:S-formylglutathione hydrolase FrmB
LRLKNHISFMKNTPLLKFLLVILLLAGSVRLSAATVDTVETTSAVMKKKIKAVVIRPDAYADILAMPVVYLLHGYGGNYAGWVKAVPALKEICDNYKIMIVCADGNISSWYFDMPGNPEWQYETYVSKELVGYIDGHYKTIADKNARAIAGLSMGGHGALYLAFKHQDVFGAAGSMSGGVDLRPFPNNWKLKERLGSLNEHPENWEKNSVTNMLHLVEPGKLAIIIDCGTEDFFYKVNLELHQKMLDRNIEHNYIARPGTHNWAYWSNAVKYQMLFFHEFFVAKSK